MFFYRSYECGGLFRRLLTFALAAFVVFAVLGLVAGLVGMAVHVVAAVLKLALLVAAAAFVWRRIARR